MSLPSSLQDNPYLDENGRTDAETYLMGVLDGSIIAGEKIVKLAKKMLPRIRDGYKQWHYDAEAATRPVEFIERFCKIPSGTIGKPLILEPYERMIVELTFGFVDDDGLRQIRYTLVLMARKQGKALSLDTEIPTPGGWRKMADIHVGDKVFGQNGRPSKVIAESEIFDKPMYLVTFEDGAKIKASADHLWTVRRDNTESWRNLTTEEMANTLGNRLYYVPACAPVLYDEKQYDVEPYEYAMSHHDEPISDIYLQGSVMQRMAYLTGLAEACGDTISRWDSVILHFNNRNAVESCLELLASLGYTHNSVLKRQGKWKHAVEFWPGSIGNVKWIASVERIPNEPSKCIAIDNDSHLYLAGRQYTATHNTTLCAAIELYMLVADHEGSPQVYNIATSRAQASLGFGAVTKMVKQSPELKKLIQRRRVVERAEVGLVCEANLGYVISLSKQPEYLDGLDVHMVVVDEMAAMKDRSTYDLLRQGMGARRQPLIMAITTEGRVRDGLWDSEHAYAERWLDDKLEEEDDRFLGILFEQDDKSELFGPEENWTKSNPGLGTVKQIEYLRGEVVKAKNDPSYLPTVLTKEFNLKANRATAFLTYEESYNNTTYEFDRRKFRYCICGFDAADTLDLNAAAALFMTPGDDHIYRRSMYWMAQEQLDVNRNSQRGRDGVPYELWEKQGYLRIVDGNKVDRRVFLDWIDELYRDGLFCVGVGHDRWGMKEIDDELKIRIGDKNLIHIPFGAQTLSTPMKQIKSDMRIGRIIDNDNPIDHWCNANVTVKEDVNGGIQPIKLGGATSRIDGFAALLCAYKVLVFDKWADYSALIGL